MIRLRNADEWVGLVVLVAIGLFVAAVLHAAVLRDWFNPAGTLRLVLPEAGLSGLAAGADVQVLGTVAGHIDRIVIDPKAGIYAEASIDRQWEDYIRRDSTATIRRTFGVAGAAYVDISRGSGQPLDWRYAVLNAKTERGASDDVNALIEQARQQITPMLADLARAVHAFADVTERLDKGQGGLGQVLADPAIAQDTRRILDQLAQSSAALNTMLASAQRIVTSAQGVVTDAADRRNGVPDVLRRVDGILANVQKTSADLAATSRRLPAIASQVQEGTATLPAVLVQAQATAAELQKLLEQLRGLALLGGGGKPVAPAGGALPVGSISP